MRGIDDQFNQVAIASPLLHTIREIAASIHLVALANRWKWTCAEFPLECAALLARTRTEISSSGIKRGIGRIARWIGECYYNSLRQVLSDVCAPDKRTEDRPAFISSSRWHAESPISQFNPHGADFRNYALLRRFPE